MLKFLHLLRRTNRNSPPSITFFTTQKGFPCFEPEGREDARWELSELLNFVFLCYKSTVPHIPPLSRYFSFVGREPPLDHNGDDQ
jgi:hypothetical protein